MKFAKHCMVALVLVSWSSTTAFAQVTLVEGGHTLIQHVDSAAPLHPSQTQLETLSTGNIESIAIDKNTGDLYVQLDNFLVSTDIFKIAPGGVVSPVALNTGFGINERGTDMHLDLVTGLLVTMDQNASPMRVATVNPVSGLIGTYSDVTVPLFDLSSFGMQFSTGAGGSDVPAGDIVFTSDLAAGGLHSVTFGGITQTTHVSQASLPGGGDDMIIQPDGDWVWVGDFQNGIIAFSPVPAHAGAVSGLLVETMFTNNALPFIAGTRAASCEGTGEFYISFSANFGGSGIFRVDEPLTTSTLVATIGAPNFLEGLQDMIVGPASSGVGTSLYFTVHDGPAASEEVWELTLPECPLPECFLVMGSDPGADTFNAGAHTWSTQLSDLRGHYPVTLADIPDFPVPASPELPTFRPRVSGTWNGPSWQPEPYSRFYAQVVMWNPQDFPQNPEQYTPLLEVSIWHNGAVTGRIQGSGDGMTISLKTFTGEDGQRYFTFPFTIDGL